MCSILGAFWFRGIPPGVKARMEGALEILKSRGPDESFLIPIGGNFLMGGNRLIIRGGLGIGTMPFTYDGMTLAYNGEIYNYEEWNNKAQSDGEIILPLIAQFGVEEGIKKLDGEFAISIWDSKHHRLILARDPFGTKPLYFSVSANRIIYASSEAAINTIERHEYCIPFKGPTFNINNSVQEPYTSFSGIWSLPPGHILIVDEQGLNMRCYNSWNERRRKTLRTENLFKALETSISKRLRHHQAIAIPLSAGIDSGIIAFTAEKLNIKYKIFSIVKIFGKETQEATHIYKRIELLKNAEDVILIDFKKEDYWESLENVYNCNYYNTERYEPGIPLLYRLMKEIKQHGIRVAIDGTGGDELFHGYKFRDKFRPIPGWPIVWKRDYYFYSLFSLLLNNNSKVDTAGASFSLETRFPFQSVSIMKEALRLKISPKTKWPLRNYLQQMKNYGIFSSFDGDQKHGFVLKENKERIIAEMRNAWSKANPKLGHEKKVDFVEYPFQIGRNSFLTL